MHLDAVQKQQFQDRLKRVSAGGANTTKQMYAGTAESVGKRKKYETRESHQTVVQTKSRRPNIVTLTISGLLIGAVAVVLARYARFQISDGALVGPDADLIMAADILLALAIAIMLRTVFRFKSRTHGVAKILGVVAMITLMQNAVHMAPEPFEKAFSTSWVRHVITKTKPNSLLFAGVSYELPMNAASRDTALAGAL